MFAKSFVFKKDKIHFTFTWSHLKTLEKTCMGVGYIKNEIRLYICENRQKKNLF